MLSYQKLSHFCWEVFPEARVQEKCQTEEKFSASCLRFSPSCPDPDSDSHFPFPCDVAKKRCEAEMSMQRHLHFRCLLSQLCLPILIRIRILNLCLHCSRAFDLLTLAQNGNKWRLLQLPQLPQLLLPICLLSKFSMMINVTGEEREKLYIDNFCLSFPVPAQPNAPSPLSIQFKIVNLAFSRIINWRLFSSLLGWGDSGLHSFLSAPGQLSFVCRP